MSVHPGSHDEPSTADLLALVAAATDRLEATMEGLAAGALAEPSTLPSWSRAHVLTHLARNADGLRSLLLAARTGAPLRMYASPEARDADIETGATRPGAVVIADAVEASRRFAVEAAAMPATSWLEDVVFTSGRPDAPSLPARQLLVRRLCEVEVHHVDLDAGYDFSDTPEALAALFLADWAGAPRGGARRRRCPRVAPHRPRHRHRHGLPRQERRPARLARRPKRRLGRRRGGRRAARRARAPLVSWQVEAPRKGFKRRC